ncbi:hypothetical protein [Haloprofundus halophilus]|uniref:hypothetical protein n=1 Tax=Haloprofundus halophilus TaxID=2283527 RepID=UPI000E450333|nr:hypothetical protein [Haloprofundus halophilus]
MSDEGKTNEEGDSLNAVQRWLYLTGSRRIITLVVVLGVFVVVRLLTEVGVLHVASGSYLATLMGSGTFSGLLTLVTVVLSINQLILSRVFGSPSDLSEQLEGNLEFRRNVEDVVGAPNSPNEPGPFLAFLGDALQREAGSLQERLDGEDRELAGEVESYTAALVDYGEHLTHGRSDNSTVDVLLLCLGSEYADHLDATRKLKRQHHDRLSEEASEQFDDLLELLKGVATVRQFFKTLAIQQDLARLSRRLIYLGLGALLVVYCFTQVYKSPSSMSPTLTASTLRWVSSVVAAVVFAPVALLMSYLLRVATLTLYTVSVGSFVPPEERLESP